MNRRSAFLITAVLIGAAPSLALGVAVPFLGWGYSIGYGIAYAAGSQAHRQGYAWSTLFDPPATVRRGRVSFAYDPSLITIRPEYSGFLGAFSNNPAVDVPYVPGGYYPPFDVSTIPGPRPGMAWNLNVGPNTVTLDFDLGPNGVAVNQGEHVNFFTLYLETSQELAGWIVESTSTGQFRELGSPGDQTRTFMICADEFGLEHYCGEITTLGLTAVPIPEPATLALLAAGGLAMACGQRSRCRRRLG